MKGSLYSPTQAAMAAFLGSPLASALVMKTNFAVIGDSAGEKNSVKFGSMAVALLLCLLPFLPENFPGSVIPVVTIVTTRLLVEKYQLTKAAIASSEEYQFQSNWKVASVGLITGLITMAIAVALILVLGSLGVVDLD